MHRRAAQLRLPGKAGVAYPCTSRCPSRRCAPYQFCVERRCESRLMSRPGWRTERADRERRRRRAHHTDATSECSRRNAERQTTIRRMGIRWAGAEIERTHRTNKSQRPYAVYQTTAQGGWEAQAHKQRKNLIIRLERGIVSSLGAVVVSPHSPRQHAVNLCDTNTCVARYLGRRLHDHACFRSPMPDAYVSGDSHRGQRCSPALVAHMTAWLTPAVRRHAFRGMQSGAGEHTASGWLRSEHGRAEPQQRKPRAGARGRIKQPALAFARSSPHSPCDVMGAGDGGSARLWRAQRWADGLEEVLECILALRWRDATSNASDGRQHALAATPQPNMKSSIERCTQ